MKKGHGRRHTVKTNRSLPQQASSYTTHQLLKVTWRCTSCQLLLHTCTLLMLQQQAPSTTELKPEYESNKHTNMICLRRHIVKSRQLKTTKTLSVHLTHKGNEDLLIRQQQQAPPRPSTVLVSTTALTKGPFPKLNMCKSCDYRSTVLLPQASITVGPCESDSVAFKIQSCIKSMDTMQHAVC